MMDVYKRKSDRSICDNSRGIVLLDHALKALLGILIGAANEMYPLKMPDSQFGAIPPRSCDFATHSLLAAVDAAQLL